MPEGHGHDKTTKIQWLVGAVNWEQTASENNT